MGRYRGLLVIFLVLFFIAGCSVFDAVVEQAIHQTQTAGYKPPTKTAILAITYTLPPVPTKTAKTVKPTATRTKSPTTPACKSPSSVTSADKGKSLEICGKVTDYGYVRCRTCPSGYYSFLTLDGKFNIISYDWIFGSSNLGDCVKVKDKVEMMGSKPIFVMGAKEGYDGSECTIGHYGTKYCDLGDYLQSYSGCK